MASRLTTFLVVVIVAGTLVAGWIVGAQRDDLNGPVDVIITNGRVYTGTPGVFAEAVAIRGNKILRVGGNREIKRLRRPQTTMLDAHGGAVVPGFNDASADLLAAGPGPTAVDLSGARSLVQMRALLRDFAAAHAERTWILGRGVSPDAVKDGLLTRNQLDDVVPDRPVMLTAADGHAAWVNSRALAAAGITDRTRNPRLGNIVRDPRSGEATGLLEESAVALVREVVPAVSRGEQISALRAAIGAAQAAGVTSVQTVVGNVEELELFHELQRLGELGVRVYAAVAVPTPMDEDAVSQLDAILKQYPDDPVFKAGAVRLALDGPVHTRSAALLSPYSGRVPSGRAQWTVADLDRTLIALDRRGWQLWLQANGDGAVRLALDTLAHVQVVNPMPVRGRRHRIDGLDLVDAADLPRFAALGVIAAPHVAWADPEMLDTWRAVVGEARESQGWRVRSLLATGAQVSFGSGWPAAPVDPRRLLHIATARTDRTEDPAGEVADESTSLEAAVDALTRAGAYASFDEQRKGRLEAGMLADLVILTGDIFQPGATPLDADVAVTIFDGAVVFDHEQAENADETD